MAEEKIYTIPLRKEWLKVPIYKRSAKAIRATKQFLSKHLKKEVMLGPYLNEFIWGKGNRHPPGKVKVRVEEEGEKLVAELINAPKKEKKAEKKSKVPKFLQKKEVEAENVDEKKEEELKEKKEETKKAIEKVPTAHELARESGIADKREASNKKEGIIPTEKVGQLRSN